MLGDPHRSVVLDLARTIPDDVDWALTGSAGFALRGLPFDPDDVDVQTDEAGAYRIEAAFDEHVADPVSFVESERIQSHYGALDVDGVEVELMGAVQKRQPDGTWEAPVDVTEHREFLTLADEAVPVLSLAYEVEAYRRYGREERAERLAAHLDESEVREL